MAQLLTSPVKVPTRGDFGHRNGTGPRARTGRSDARVTLDDEGHAYHRSGTAEVLEIRRDDEAGPAEHGAATAVYDAEPEVAPFRYDDLDSDASDGDGALGGLGGAAASFIRPRSSGSSRPRTSKSRPGSSHSRASAGGGIHGALSRAKSASAGTGRQRGSRRSRRPSTGASRGGRPKTTGGLSRRRPDYASTWGDKLHFSRRPRGDPLMTRHLPLHLRKNTFFSSHPPLKPPPSALNRFVPLDERRFTTFEQLADEYDYLDDPRRLERSRPGTSAMKLLRKKSSRQMDYAREFLQPETPSPGAFGPTSSTLPRTSSGYGQRLRSRGPTEEEENPFAPSPMKRTFSSIDAFKIKPDAEELLRRVESTGSFHHRREAAGVKEGFKIPSSKGKRCVVKELPSCKAASVAAGGVGGTRRNTLVVHREPDIEPVMFRQVLRPRPMPTQPAFTPATRDESA